MKKLILTIAIILLATTANAWTINGIPINQFKAHPGKAVFGATASVLAHCISHHAAASLIGKSMRQEGFQEVWQGPYTRKEEAMVGRAGFVGQLALGYILNRAGADRDFMVGYNGWSFIEISTYKMIHGDKPRDARCDIGYADLGNINASSNADAELALYINTSLYLLKTTK